MAIPDKVDAKTFKTVMLVTVGSRGDVQPFVACGCRLQEYGYDCTLVSNINHCDFSEKAGLKAKGPWPDSEEQARSSPELLKAMRNGDVETFMAAMDKVDVASGESSTKGWMEVVKELQPDLVICGSLCDIVGMVCERYFQIPTIQANLAVVPPNPPKMVFGLPNIPCCGINRFLAGRILRSQAQSGVNCTGPTLKKAYDIDWQNLFTMQELIDASASPPPSTVKFLGMDPLIATHVYGGKELVPPRVELLGFWAMDSKKQVSVVKGGEEKAAAPSGFGNPEALNAVDKFCAEGSTPAYLGFGSMTAKSPEYMVTLVCGAVKHAGVRAIVQSGWAGMTLELLKKSTKDQALVDYTEKNVLFLGAAPHEWLFPKCACIVHHGGAGTISTASRSGVPQVITPIWLDQWDTAHFLSAYGAGIGCGQLTKISPAEVGDAMKKVMTDEKIKAKAKEWGKIGMEEDGTKMFVEATEKWFKNEVATGNYAKYVRKSLDALKKK